MSRSTVAIEDFGTVECEWHRTARVYLDLERRKLTLQVLNRGKHEGYVALTPEQVHELRDLLNDAAEKCASMEEFR